MGSQLSQLYLEPEENVPSYLSSLSDEAMIEIMNDSTLWIDTIDSALSIYTQIGEFNRKSNSTFQKIKMKLSKKARTEANRYADALMAKAIAIFESEESAQLVIIVEYEVRKKNHSDIIPYYKQISNVRHALSHIRSRLVGDLFLAITEENYKRMG